MDSFATRIQSYINLLSLYECDINWALTITDVMECKTGLNCTTKCFWSHALESGNTFKVKHHVLNINIQHKYYWGIFYDVGNQIRC